MAVASIESFRPRHVDVKAAKPQATESFHPRRASVPDKPPTQTTETAIEKFLHGNSNPSRNPHKKPPVPSEPSAEISPSEGENSSNSPPEWSMNKMNKISIEKICEMLDYCRGYSRMWGTVTPAQIKLLASRLKYVEADQGDLVLSSDWQAESLHILLSGEVRFVNVP
jgi:hypothetical protein